MESISCPLVFFFWGRGWSGFRVWGLRKWGVMEVKKLGRSYQSVSWFERGGRHCVLFWHHFLCWISVYYWRFWWTEPGCLSDVTSWISWHLNFACHMPASGRQKRWSNSFALNSPGKKQQPACVPLSPKEGWFLFDSMLTIMMIWDTWFLACSCVGQHRCWDARRWNVDDLLNSLSSEAERTRWWVEFRFEPF